KRVTQQKSIALQTKTASNFVQYKDDLEIDAPASVASDLGLPAQLMSQESRIETLAPRRVTMDRCCRRRQRVDGFHPARLLSEADSRHTGTRSPAVAELRGDIWRLRPNPAFLRAPRRSSRRRLTLSDAPC